MRDSHGILATNSIAQRMATDEQIKAAYQVRAMWSWVIRNGRGMVCAEGFDTTQQACLDGAICEMAAFALDGGVDDDDVADDDPDQETFFDCSGFRFLLWPPEEVAEVAWAAGDIPEGRA